jgi:hypothetical protein
MVLGFQLLAASSVSFLFGIGVILSKAKDLARSGSNAGWHSNSTRAILRD